MENNSSPHGTLDECINSINELLLQENLSISFLFRGYVRDFIAGSQLLTELDAKSEEFRLVSRKLCEVSRELNFSTSPSIPDDLYNSIEWLFDYVHRNIPQHISDEIDAYRRNIGFRVNELTS